MVREVSTPGKIADTFAPMSGPGKNPPLDGKPKRVVAVTSAHDFLGKHLVALLAEDPAYERVIAIDSDDPRASHRDANAAKVRTYRVDASQPSSAARLAEVFEAERVDTLLHLAFLSAPSRAAAWAHELESVGTRNTLVAARKARLQKVVMASQTLLYGARPENPSHMVESSPLRPPNDPYFTDKVAAEGEVRRFAEQMREVNGACVTVLRTAPLLGPTVDTWLTRILSRRLIPTLMGFDPLVQLLHEVDALAAFKLATDHDVPGTFNIVGDGVLPFSTVVRLLGKIAVPVPLPAAAAAVSALWLTSLSAVPRAFVPYLRYVCIADGTLARERLGFSPAHSAQEAVLDFASASRLRDTLMLSEEAR